MKKIGELAKDRTLETTMVDEGTGIEPLAFTKVTDYTTFIAEYAFDGDEEDMVFHFFLTPEHHEAALQYPPHVYIRRMWANDDGFFPTVMAEFAQKFFQMGYPQLRATYTQELSSWWLRCTGAGNTLDRDGRAVLFLRLLDEALDKAAVGPAQKSTDDR